MVVTLAYGPAALPEGVPEEDLALNIFEDGEWIVPEAPWIRSRRP